PNRRQERTPFLFKTLESAEIPIDVIHDWSTFETQNQFLEGTGSLVLDRVHRIAYAAISNRTHPDLVQEFCSTMNYESVVFSAFQSVDGRREAIYHTNVLMGLGPNFAVICLDTIDDAHERQRVENKLQTTGKQIIALSTEQMHQMAGNMICLHNQREWLLVMSARAFRSLTPHQKNLLQTHAKLVYSDLDTIETLGGGSARCMITEVF
ncbi:MAG: arginine deiminase-related protein, partial [Flavobacteriaceae bacterium]